MELIIRKIKEEDYLTVHAFQYEYLDQETYECFLSRVNANPDFYISAFYREELAGICYGEPSRKDRSSVCLQGIAVNLDEKKGLYRHGIGSILLKSFEETVNGKGYHRISLGSADDDKVEKFYIKNGYQPYELVVKGPDFRELIRVRINSYENGILVKQELYRKYHPKEIIFIFEKLLA